MKIIRLAIRTLLRFRLYTGVNIVGLALSLACALIISRYVYQELTVDHFNKKLDRISITINQREGDTEWRLSGVENRNKEAAFVDPLQSPMIERHSSMYPFPDDNILVGEQGFNACVYATDSNFLKILDFPLIQGSAKTVLTEPTSAVITRSFAQKVFGKENPMGKTLTHSSGKQVTINGVIDNSKGKSSFYFDLLVSSELQQRWSRMSQTLVLTVPGADLEKLNKQNEKFMDMKAWGYKIRYRFFPLTKLYFDKSVRFYDGLITQGNYSNVIILSVVAFLVLLVGVFNFVNIYTVLMLKRAREFGMKKVFGGRSGYMILQLFAENLVMIGLALGIGWFFIEITRGLIESLLGIPQTYNYTFDLTISLAILLLLPLITSIYPFIRYNYTTPISSLRSVSTGGNSTVSRALFLVMQYIITFTLVVVSIFFVKQLHFMLNADLGYRTENIIKAQFQKHQTSYDGVSDEEWKARRDKEERVQAEIKQRMNASTLFTAWEYGESPHEFMKGHSKFKVPDGEFQEIAYRSLSDKYFKMHNFQLKEGRLWNDTIDKDLEYNLIINETAQKLFGITSLETALLQPERRMWWSSLNGDMSKNPPYRIVGVIKDFQGTHLSKATPPLAIAYGGGWFNSKLTAAVVAGKQQEAIHFLQKLHDDTVGGEFEYSFLEDEIADLYREDKRVATIYSTFALIAILISSLGLFSLSLFDVQQRYREIALRKVNGATIKDILLLLLRKYYILLGIAFIIATPVSVMAINKYMEGFVNRTALSWWIFVIAALLTAIISLATLVFQARKAANSNPMDILKGE